MTILGGAALAPANNSTTAAHGSAVIVPLLRTVLEVHGTLGLSLRHADARRRAQRGGIEYENLHTPRVRTLHAVLCKLHARRGVDV